MRSHGPDSARSINPFAVLAIGVVVVSFASILIRWAGAEGVPSIAIAAWRLAFAALILAPVVGWRGCGEITALGPRDRWLVVAAGAFLAAHFASWILSLEYTSVASSTVLVTTNPIWLALLSFWLFGERISGGVVAAIGLAILGSALIFLADAGAQNPNSNGATGRSVALGNLLAILGSLTMCGYLLLGRGLRARVGLVSYIGVVYAVAAVVLMLVAMALGTQLTGYSASAWVMLLALAIGPQLIGHGALNYALAHLPATVIAIGILGEPIGSTLLAWLLLGESIGPMKMVGMAVLLVGIFLATRRRA